MRFLPVLVLAISGFLFSPVGCYSQKQLPKGIEAKLDSLGAAWTGVAAPGFVAGVAWKGEICYLKAFGKAFPDGPPMEKDAIFRLASMTKPVTGMAAAVLIAAGRLNLDDPVARYLPCFSELSTLDGVSLPVEDSLLRIRHLLTHTAGFSYGSFDTTIRPHYQAIEFVDAFTTAPLTLEENILNLARAPLRHAPGEAWTYGVSIDVLGRVIEVVTGKSLGEYFNELFFEPLRMTDTGFRIDPEKVNRVAPVSYARGKEWFMYPEDDPSGQIATYPYRGAMTYEAPGAGLVGTASDYLAFAGMLAGMGVWKGKRIVDTKAVSLAGSNVMPYLPESNFKAFGAGMSIIPASEPDGKPQRMDWSGLFNTYFMASPDRDLAVVLLFQLFPSDNSEYWRIWLSQLDQL